MWIVVPHRVNGVLPSCNLFFLIYHPVKKFVLEYPLIGHSKTNFFLQGLINKKKIRRKNQK